jgi:hypothetical protein
MLTQELEARFAKLGQTAKDSGSFVVAATLPAEEDDKYQVQLELDVFMSLLSACRPRVLYVHRYGFEARASLAPWFQLDDEEEGTEREDDPPSIAELLGQVARYEGELCSFMASFFVDGVRHTAYEGTGWLNKFQDDAREAVEALNEERQREDDAESELDAAKTREYATTLSEHPKFNEGRVSREKREYLAQSLFPDLDDMEISGVVDEATNMNWLKTGK